MRRTAPASALAAALTVLAASVMGCSDDAPAAADQGTGFRDTGAGRVDLGPPQCSLPALPGELGGACRVDLQPACNEGLVCIAESSLEVGGASDPILDVPDGGTGSFTLVDFPGGYCAPMLATSGSCSTADRGACASLCGACANIFTDGNVCLDQCTPNAVDNDLCRDGYECDVLRAACDTGCASDDECRVTREDTNMSGAIELYDAESGLGDRLVYHPGSEAFCNPDTARCEHPGTPGAVAGDPCVFNEECERNGRCLDELRFDFPGGYCSKYRCDFAGNACADAGSVCNSRGVGFPVCLEGCTLGTGVTPGDTSTYLGNTQGCRAAYACVWDGRSGETPLNGGCLPGNYNGVVAPNVGAPCEDSSQCYSPFGQGFCLTTGNPGGYCSVLDCDTVGMPSDLCGGGNICVEISAGRRLCMRSCADATDCRAGYACSDVDGDPLTPGSACFGDCLSDEECRAGETCVSGACG